MRAIAALLFAGAASAVDVYLHPAPETTLVSVGAATPDRATLAISHHLGLEFDDSVEDDAHVFVNELVSGNPFIGRGQEDGLLITMNEEEARDVIPSTFKPAFQLATPPVDTLDTLINTYIHRAAKAFSTIYSSSSAANLHVPRMLDVLSTSAKADTLLNELSTLTAFLEEPEPTNGAGKFAAMELTGLAHIAEAYGKDSEQYTVAASTVKATLQSALAKPDTRVVLLTFSSAGSDKRADETLQPPQSPLPAPDKGKTTPRLPSSGQCFTTADACSNATDTCSGHGACASTKRAGRECFVCACGATKDSRNRTQAWAGTSCQRQDLSESFSLLAGTVITLILLVGGSISLIYSVGAVELPSLLTGAGPGKSH